MLESIIEIIADGSLSFAIAPVFLAPLALGGGAAASGAAGGLVASGGASGVLNAVGGLSGVTNALKSVINGKVFSKTIGQALKGGIKCWGATWTPDRAEKDLPVWYGRISELFKKSLNVEKDGLEKSVNDFFKTFWFKVREDYDYNKTLEGWLGWRYDSAKDCTLKGLIALEKGIDGYLKELEGVFSEIGPEINANIKVSHKTITLYRERNKKGKPYTKTVPQIKVTLLPEKNDGVVGSASPLNGGSTGNSSESENKNPKPTSLGDYWLNQDDKTLDSKESISVMGSVGLGLMGLFALVATTGNNKGKSKGKKLFR